MSLPHGREVEELVFEEHGGMPRVSFVDCRHVWFFALEVAQVVHFRFSTGVLLLW